MGDEPNVITLLLFFDPLNTSHKGKLVYAQALHNKFKVHGLEIIGISSKDKLEIEHFQLQANFSFPIIADKNEEIYDKFHINDCCGGTVLVNNSGHTFFQIKTLAENENLRQLVEKALLGKISYDFQVKGPLITDKIPHIISTISLREKYSNKFKSILDFEEENLIISFFSSLCSFCKSGTRIETLKKLNKLCQEKNVTAKNKIILVFFKPFDEHDIEFWENNLKMPFDTYFSEDLFSDDEKYITDPSLKLDPVTIVLDEKREIIFLESLNMDEKEILDFLTKTLLIERE